VIKVILYAYKVQLLISLSQNVALRWTFLAVTNALAYYVIFGLELKKVL